MSYEWRGEEVHTTYSVWKYCDDNGEHARDLQLHHNYATKTGKTGITGMVAFAYKWMIFIHGSDGLNGTGWHKVPDECTTLEERQAWALAMEAII